MRGGGRGGQEGRGQGGGGVGGRGVGGQREGGGQGGGRGGERRRRMVISNEIWAAVVDHMLNHGLNMREAGQSVHQISAASQLLPSLETSGWRTGTKSICLAYCNTAYQ